MTDRLPMPSAVALVERLAQKNWTISLAESCTGGLGAASLVDVAKASGVLEASFVTYAPEAKIRMVNVSPDSIASCGVVSETVAGEMARGAAHAADARVGVGITGFAGPSGGEPGKPVGTVCFGFWIGGRLHTATQCFADMGRNAVREAAVRFAFERLLELLN